MNTPHRAGVALAAALAAALSIAGCTGGSETHAADDSAAATSSSTAAEPVDPRQELAAISAAIPVYPGAAIRPELTRRDSVMLGERYGEGTEVYTLASDDSFPQIYHYYTTYLAQFRAFPARQTYPSEEKQWRTLEVHLNHAMQDPFIPGTTLALHGKQVILQVAETEGESQTLIRYIVTPHAIAPPPAAIADSGGPAMSAPAEEEAVEVAGGER
ncbi:MAG TPA: hypothetical protein VFO89_13850 [Thermoanaerobaculia bacterium]|nr:hypothetical protein [Thermoanaerobaculia bacterium]